MRIAVLDDYQGVALELADWSKLQATHEVVVFREAFADLDAAAQALVGFDVAAIMRERTPFPAALLDRLPDLKLIVTTGMRNDSVDTAAAKARGITVAGTGSPGHATAELAFALILAQARGLPAQFDSMRSGGWQVGLGGDIRGKTLGIIGLGRLGSEIAGFARAFGMNVVAWSQNLTDERAAAQGARRVEKAHLFAESDFITIHVKLSERSRGLVGAAEIAAMKPTAFLVNTSRAPIIDMPALVAACRDGRIGGAALDVYEREPLPANDPLRQVPRLVLTPHIGYVTRETYQVFYPETVETIAAWIAGAPIRVISA